MHLVSDHKAAGRAAKACAWRNRIAGRLRWGAATDVDVFGRGRGVLNQAPLAHAVLSQHRCKGVGGAAGRAANDRRRHRPIRLAQTRRGRCKE